jgi:hypothetical protein
MDDRAAPALEALYATGHWLLGQGRHADAASVFRVMMSMAPVDERAWLALGACHEGIHQLDIALELYAAGGLVASPGVRCALARTRLLRALGRDDDATNALETAAERADAADDAMLRALVATERSTP